MNCLRVSLSALAVLCLLFCSRVAHAADLSAIRARGVLRVGTTGDYAPFSVAAGDTFSGLDVDLATRLAHDLGVHVQWVRFAWPELGPALQADRFDLAASGVTVRPERTLVGRYTRPYAVTGAMVLFRRKDHARFRDQAALDRAGTRIVVNRGGHLERVARRLFPHATIQTTDDNTKLADRVLAGEADAFVTDSAEARTWGRTELESLGPFTHDRKALLVQKDAAELAQWTDTWLDGRERDGWLPGLRKQRIDDVPLTPADWNREAVLEDVELRCGLMPLVKSAKIAEGLPIEDRAQEARVLERVEASARGAGLDAPAMRGLYEALIDAAKAIQRASTPDPATAAPPLADLRSAIGIIDAHLLLQLHAATGVVPPSTLRQGARENLDVPGLGAANKSKIGDALMRALPAGK